MIENCAAVDRYVFESQGRCYFYCGKSEKFRQEECDVKVSLLSLTNEEVSYLLQIWYKFT